MIIKKILTNVLTGASVTMAVLMIGIAYSDHVNPVNFPLIACLGMIFPFFIIINLLFLVAWLFIKWRKALIPLAALIICYPSIHTYFPMHGSSKIPEGCIKVVSFNVCGYVGNHDYTACFDSVYHYLKTQKADIVCLQEDMCPQKERLDSLFPYNDTVHVCNKPSMINAVGIHTRFPVLKHEIIKMPSESNGAVAFYLKVGPETVIVVNCHLESFHLSPVDKKNYKDVLKGDMSGKAAEAETRSLVKKVSVAMAKRAPQAEAVHRYIEAHRSYPIIVCGDFNDTPISYCRRVIAKGLIDCYVSTGTGSGVSYNQKGFRFRIDHIMCSDHFRPYRCKVDDSTQSSDHYPVVCWLQLDGYFNKRY